MMLTKEMVQQDLDLLPKNYKTADVDKLIRNYVTTLEYRMRLLGDNSANAVTAWSDVRTITGDEEAPISTFVSVGASDFTEEKMNTDVLEIGRAHV